MTSDGWAASTDIFETSTGFNYLAYQTAELQNGWAPYAFYEISSSGNYVIGYAPSIAVFTNGNNLVMTALEVHQGGQDNGSELWYTLGSCNPGIQQPPCGGVDWLTSQSYDVGYNPSVAIDISIEMPAVSPVVEVHQVGSGLSDLQYRVGTLTSATLNSKGLIIPPSITWGPSYPVDNPDGASVTGYAPSVSVADGYVVVAYQGTSPNLSYSFGQISGNVIGWQNPVNYGTGYSPSISMLGSDLAGGSGEIVEAHQGDTGTGPLYYRIGKLNSSTTPTGITWTPNSSTKYATSGCSPSVALQAYLPPAVLVEELHSTACGGAFPLLWSYGAF
jgi:hypothetical protein